MAKIDLTRMWSPYSDLLAIERVHEALALPLKLCKEELNSIMPSIDAGADGRRISSLYITTPNLLAEIRLEQEGENFDFVLLKSIRNYRVELGQTTIGREGQEPLIYRTAAVVLKHTVGGAFSDFVSRLSYVGDNPTEWLDSVTTAIPVNLIST